MKVAFLFLGIFFAFASLATPFAVQAQQEEIRLGPMCNVDINGDGKILPVDANRDGIISPEEKESADINRDGIVSPEEEEQACGFCQIFQLISKIVGFIMFPIVPLVATVFVVIGGFFIFISAGDENKLKQGKNILYAVAIGMLLVYGAWVLLNTFFTWIGVAEWQGFSLQQDWWRIPCNDSR